MFYLIYRTTNLVNGKYYLGKHITPDKEDAYLGSGDAITAAIKKYGAENFRREILFECPDEETMEAKEVELITLEVLADPMSYNIALGGQGGCIVLYEGHPQYASTCAKISEAKLKNSKKISDSTKALHKDRKVGMYGKKHSRETKEKMSASGKQVDRSWMKDRIVSDETRDKLRQINLGKELSEEHKRKISENHANCRGEKNPMFGKKHSEEAKRKMAEARKKKTCSLTHL